MKKVMISSTALDLPEHRKHVIDACHRVGVFPVAMEHLPARDADAIRVSPEMVDQADAYLGIFAWRYGHVPNGHSVSITEIEFDRAVARHIPIFLFTIHADHPLNIAMVETRPGAQEKLSQLKAKACADRVRSEFRSPEDLRGLVIHALAEEARREADLSGGRNAAMELHPPSHIPHAPMRFVAHPYTLLQTKDVVGRRDELHLLTDWVTTNRRIPQQIRICNVVAIGGMGKSALTWKWFEDIAPAVLPSLAGRMWWSFYESDATFDNFLIRALAYTSGMSAEEVRQIAPAERQERLLGHLDATPFLLVLDGFERILLAYARMDAAHLPDDDLDQRTGNTHTEYAPLSPEVSRGHLEKHRLRRCTDPRAGTFLRKLTQIRASRVLVSTRLYPAELQAETGHPLPGSHAFFLGGLTDADALTLWRTLLGEQASGSNARLLSYFRAFDNYPLLLRTLAGEVARYRPAPRDFDCWIRDHPDFDPASLSLRNERNAHVLRFALGGLGEIPARVLHTIAAFRMPATWATLSALLVGQGKVCSDWHAVDAALTELEDRGLIGWDSATNRYDLHPIVRAVVWSGVDGDSRHGIYQSLYHHFEAAPVLEWKQVQRPEDLTPALELYNTLIGLNRYDDAYAVWRERLDYATLWRLNLTRERTEMIALLFPDGLEKLPRLTQAADQGYMLNALATGYDGLGQPSAAVPLYRLAAEIDAREGNIAGHCDSLNDLASACSVSGRLYEAEAAGRAALLAARKIRDGVRECWSLVRLHLFRRLCGDVQSCRIALRRAAVISRLCNEPDDKEYFAGLAAARLAELALLDGNATEAQKLADVAWQKAHVERLEADFVRSSRLQGEAALASGDSTDLRRAEERLCHALTRARSINLVQEELPALLALAELRRRHGDYQESRDLLGQVWTAAESGPYSFCYTDAQNTLARLEGDLGHRQAAVEAAVAAFRLAWCDGPPYAYAHGLATARCHLMELAVTEPPLDPFIMARRDTMPEEDLNPKDEFWIDPRAQFDPNQLLASAI